MNYISVDEFELHPNRYLGNSTTIKAVFDALYPQSASDRHEDINYYVLTDIPLGWYNNRNVIGIEIPKGVNSSLLMLGETYYFTGIPGYGNYTALDNNNGQPNLGLFLRVSSINLFYIRTFALF